MANKAISKFEATMIACQKSKALTEKKKSKATKRTVKESKRRRLHEEDEFDPEDIPSDVVDDIMVIVDPELDPEDVEAMDELQEIIDETPEGEVPTTDKYLDDMVYTCPVCGNNFFSDTELSEGDECPVCGETPDAFILVGDIAESDSAEVEDEVEETATEEGTEDVETEEEEDFIEEGCGGTKRKSTRRKSAPRKESSRVSARRPMRRESARPRVRRSSVATRRESARRTTRRPARVSRLKSESARKVTRRPVSPLVRKRQMETLKRIAARRKTERLSRTSKRPTTRRTMERKAITRRPMRTSRRMESPRVRRVATPYTLDERTFNKVLTKFVRENYKNAKSMKVVSGKITKNNTLALECVIDYTSGKSAKTTLKVENFNGIRTRKLTLRATADRVFKMERNATRKTPFTMSCVAKNGVITCEKLNYDFISVKEGKKYRVYGNTLRG